MLRFDPNLRWLFTELPMWDRYTAAAQAGFSGVEVAFPYEYPARKLAAHLKDNGLTLVQVLAPVDWEGGSRGIACLPEKKDECRRSVETAIEYALGVGKPMVHVLAGNLEPHHRIDECMAVFKENLAYAADIAGREGITIIIEPVCNARFPAYLYSRLDEGTQIIDELGKPNIKLCFDTYHVQMQEGNLTERLRQVYPYIGHMQIGNTPGRNEPGVGELDLHWFFRQLEKLGWDRWIGCEYAPSTRTLASIGWHAPFTTR
ncbi:hydroxypyruvate isomerase family protein [Ramlibacter albus]|uniref:TIM barrel protein n=1 Tax=Ramlibacter albus TaxID=2079448 RepID=A0A923MEF0_9BURK|nr:TIM barrel protein [Ramlibacter albus]MBC5768056.1 TIM barrel protein [Ramlibacter albus]